MKFQLSNCRNIGRGKEPQVGTFIKSTENVPFACMRKAPFSCNQLNCKACPFLASNVNHFLVYVNSNRRTKLTLLSKEKNHTHVPLLVQSVLIGSNPPKKIHTLTSKSFLEVVPDKIEGSPSTQLYCKP